MEKTQKNVEDLSDLEIAELLQQTYSQIMLQQDNLRALNQEMQKRKAKANPESQAKAKSIPA